MPVPVDQRCFDQKDSSIVKYDFKHFWYVVCESRELTRVKPISAQILEEWLVCYRDEHGNPVALRDSCLHRAGRLSRGSVRDGVLQCPYHGWRYDGCGKVISVPAEGGEEAAAKRGLRIQPFETREQDGYIYVLLERGEHETHPFSMPHYRESPWRNLRLCNTFENNVTNCVENFIDIPHTAYVHKGIFRNERSQGIEASIRREKGSVIVSYKNETNNLGSFSWLLNPSNRPVVHTDAFYMPNVTQVTYTIGPAVAYIITSQSIPVDASKTIVYTDITYRFGMFTPIAGPLVRRQAQRVIDQDVDELNAQMEVIRKYDPPFLTSPCDIIHTYVAQIREAIAQGKNPHDLPDRQSEITFWV